MKIRILGLIFILGSFYSCATSRHSMMKGAVAMKINKSTGIACMESNQVKVGDTLYLFNNECSGSTGREGSSSCKMVKGGEVKVTRLVNDHYSEFETLSTKTEFAEGSIIGQK